MAINDPNYRYATRTFETDGVRTEYEIAFDGGYIRQSDVVAFSVRIDEGTGLAYDRQQHTLEFINEQVDPDTEWKTATVRIAPAVEAGRRLVIYRSTQKSSPLVNYTQRSLLTEKNLDLANNQAIFAVAEIMDGLREQNIVLEEQTGQVIDLNNVIHELYDQVVQMLTAAGYISTVPKLWYGVHDGTSRYMDIPGADVINPGMYDVYVNQLGVRPNLDYSIDLDHADGPKLVFAEAAEDGTPWFAVLRGYAQPYAGAPPITSLRWPVRRIETPTYFVSKDDEFAVCSVYTDEATTIYVPTIPTFGQPDERMGVGSFMSFVQRGSGQVSLVADGPDVTLVVPNGLVARTRVPGSTITMLCEDAETNTWIVSGDLALED